MLGWRCEHRLASDGLLARLQTLLRLVKVRRLRCRHRAPRVARLVMSSGERAESRARHECRDGTARVQGRQHGTARVQDPREGGLRTTTVRARAWMKAATSS